MDLYISVIISGIAVGATYALVAVGITQIFVVTRVLNFAQAGFTVWGAYLYATFTWDHDWPVGIAALATIVIVGLMGLAVERTMLRFAQRAPNVNKMLMTFGLLNFLIALAAIVFGLDTRASVSLFPNRGFNVFGTQISWQRFASMLAVVIVVSSLTLFLRRTRVGLQTRALAENITIAELMGVNRNRIGMFNWVIAAMVSGLAGILSASLQPFQAGLFVAYFLFALVATLVGGLRSLTGSALGGVALGVITSVMQLASTSTGMGTLVIFGGVALLVLLRRRWPAELSKIDLRQPQRRHAARLWWLNRSVVAVGAVALVVAAFGGDVWGLVGATMMVYAVASLSLVPVIGWTGQISLAQGGFMAIGASAMASASHRHGLNLPLSILVTLIVGALTGTLVGIICFRISIVQTAIVTMAFTGVVVSWFAFTPFFPGPVGRLAVTTPSYLDSGRSAFIGFAIVAVIVAVLLANIRRSHWGVTFISVRTAPDMARHFGLRPPLVRVAAFTVSGAVAGVAGAMYLQMVSTMDLRTFGIALSLQVLILAVAGGTSSVTGSFVGPLVFLAAPQALSLQGISGWPTLLLGIGSIVLIATRPDGVLSLLRRPTALDQQAAAPTR